MTRTFAVDANNDIFIGLDDRLSFNAELDALLQLCEHAATTLLGEMVLAADQGVPYFQALWSGRPNLPVWEAAFRQRVLAVEGVTAIVALTTRRDGDRLIYSATIRTTFGTGTIGNANV